MSFAPEVIKKLSAPLDPGRIRHREGSGGKSLSYLEGHDVIRAANDVFGIGNWTYFVTELSLLGEEPVVKTYNGQTREGFRVAYRAVVTVGSGGSGFSDVGFGDAVEYVGSKLTPHELASKEAVTDALKRALKNFGDQFGLCLYDKAYVPPAPGTGATQVSSSAGTSGGSGGSGVGEQGLTANGASSPAPTNSDWRWPFGKHKGKTLAETDEGYLTWFLENSDKEDIKDRVREFINLRDLAAAGGTFDDPDSDVPF